MNDFGPRLPNETDNFVNRICAIPVKHLSRLQSWYRVAAFGVFNSILLLLVLNLVLYAAISARRRGRVDSPIVKYGEDALLKAYPGWKQQDVKTLLEESYRDSKLEYEPFTEFRNKPLQGKFVNVDVAGSRVSKDQAPWPRVDAFNVFVFGGSTTFGMGLPDDETIASYLQKCAVTHHSGSPVAVYNFGPVYYMSRQEEILFQQLLQAGFVPHAAVFIDGLNDFTLFPDGQPRFSVMFQRFMAGQVSSSALDNLPIVKAAHLLSNRWRKSGNLES